MPYDPANDPWTTQFSQPQVSTSPGDNLFAAWGSAAPSLPSNLLHQFASSGVSPADPVGSWVIRTGVAALGSTKPIGQGTTEGQAAARLLSNPQLLAQIKQLPLDKQTDVFKMSASQAGALSDEQLIRLAQTGETKVHHSIFNKIGDYLTTGVRGAFTGLAAPLEGLEAAYRSSQYGLKQIPSADVLGLNKKISAAPPTGGLSDITDQITLTHALAGQSTGGGFFPGGPARESAIQAQQAAASINGHALTPGRAVAGAVVQPGTFPYQVMSGVVDATVAIHADPAILALGEISDAAKAARVFAPTTDAARVSAAKFLVDGANGSGAVGALRTWTAVGADEEPNLVRAIASKLHADPGSLQSLVGHPELNLSTKDIASAVGRDHTGMIQGLRNLVDRPTAMSWLNSKAGTDYAEWAANHSFTDIWNTSGRKMPVSVVAQLHDATNPDQVRTILGQALGTLVRGVPEGVMPYAWKHPLGDLRLAQYLPKGTVDVENLDNAVEQTRRMLVNAKVSGFHDDLLADIAKSGDRTQFYGAYTNALDAIKDTLTTRGVNRDLAKTLTRFQVDGTIEDQARWVNETGSTPLLSGMASAGDTVPLMGPHLSSELLNRALPVLDMRTINRNVGTWGQIWNHPVLGPAVKGATYLSDALTNTFKVFTLLKGALPARFLADEHARMATAGLDSLWTHPWKIAQESGLLEEGRHNPLAFIAHVIGSPTMTEHDLTGERWVDHLGNAQSAYKRAVGESAKWSDSIFDADTQLSKHYVTYDAQHPAYTRAWADELSHLHVTPESREVARALADVSYAPAGVDGQGGVDAVKEWFWSGAGQQTRQELADAHLWGGTSDELGHSRVASDGFIDSVVDRVKLATGEHPELTDAVAHGEGFGLHGTSRDFRGLLGDLRAEGVGPQSIRGRATAASRGNPRVVRNMVDRMMAALMDAPTQTLTRSPAFKQTYLQRFDELSPYIHDGTIDAVKADQIAKSYALQSVRDLLYYPGERISATDKLRNVMPFGEAWRNVLKTWTKLGTENPRVFRRVEQGLTSLRDGGFVYQDPQSGKEVFTMVPAGLMKHLTGVPFPMTAPVAGVNILGAGLPGIGPAIQVPADALLPKGNIISDTLRQHLLPYGSPDYTGGMFESLFPGWADKIRTSGFLMHYLPGNPQLPFLTPSADKKRVLTDLAQSVFGYHMSAGNYNMSDPAVLAKLTKQSLWEAQKLYLLRGLAQFAAPAAPNVTQETQLKDGSLLETWLLAQDYRTMETAYPNLDQATLAFVNKYGPKAIFAAQPHAQRAPFAIPTTEEASIWRNQHADFAAKYPNTYAEWAPSQGQFSYETYLDQIRRGELVPRSVPDWAKLAEARLGNAVYSTLRSRLGPSPNAAQRDWLAAQKDQITAQYPGFNQDTLKLGRLTMDQTVTELQNAVNDPEVARTPLAQGARTYMNLRDQALQAAQARTGRSTTGLSGKSMSDLRAWLYENGQRIALRWPDFQNLWDDTFVREVEPTQ